MECREPAAEKSLVAPASSRSIFSMLGPGLLFAATSVGASHLVQSTRAGAVYGLALLGIILLANAIKYPAFRFASDYYPATGTSLLEAYRRQGKAVLLVFAVITLSTLLFAVSALALMAAGLIKVVFSISLAAQTIALGLIVCTSVMLVVGHYKTLERLTKVLIILMVVCTLVATMMILPEVHWGQSMTLFSSELDIASLLFIAALMGWMPVPLDASVWQSLWAKAKAENSDLPPTLAESRFDFNVGYSAIIVLAICFLLMGAGIMHGKGIVLASGSAAFSAQLIHLYETVLGGFFGPLIGIAATAIVYSSLLAIMDAFPRTLSSLYRRWQDIPEAEDDHSLVESHPFYIAVLVVMFLGAVLTYQFFLTSLTALVDLAATVAFVAAPFIAYLNHRAITAETVPLSCQPSVAFRRYSIVCIGLLLVFAVGYSVLRFG